MAWIGNLLVIVIPILLSFLLTAAIGNRLLQRWQQRSWLQQQAVLQAHKEIDEVKSTIDDFIALADTRSFRARRLLRNLSSSNLKRLAQIREDYDNSVAAWNDKLNSFQVRLTIYARYDFALRIDNDIQPQFAKISEELDYLAGLTSEKIGKTTLSFAKASLEEELNSLNGSLFDFSRDVMRYLVDQQRAIYVGKPIHFSSENIELFSTWYLFKELFKASHPPQSIFGAPFNSTIPRAFWD